MEEGSFGNYATRLRRQDKTPYDPFSHAHSLLVPSEKKKPVDMHKLVDRDMMLGNIDNDQLLRLYQAEIHSLTNLASMAVNDPEIQPFYEMKYAALRGELAITRAHKGMERIRQDAFGRVGMEGSGFGSTLNDVGYGHEDEKGGIKDKLGGLGNMMPTMPKSNPEMFK